MTSPDEPCRYGDRLSEEDGPEPEPIRKERMQIHVKEIEGGAFVFIGTPDGPQTSVQWYPDHTYCVTIGAYHKEGELVYDSNPSGEAEVPTEGAAA